MPRFTLTEWQTIEVSTDSLSENQLNRLFEISEQHKWFSVEQHFRRPDVLFLKASNYVGQCVLPVKLEESVEVVILPKIPLFSLMDWWCWSQQAITPGQNLIPLETVTDVLEQIFAWLAHGVLRIAKQGLLTEYVRHESFMSDIRGQISIPKSLPALYQGRPELYCRYDQRTVDIQDNQILLWTLHQARRWSFRHESVRHSVNQAYRHLSGVIQLKPVSAQTCFNRTYTRLNRHYERLHQWCGMILSHLTFSEQTGEQPSPTFMLEISRIFEQAVANYLQRYIPAPLEVLPQHHYLVSQDPYIAFDIDLVIRDSPTGSTRMVMDTKYKNKDRPTREDVFQITSYAVSQRTQEGVLVYPMPFASPMDAWVDNIRLRSLCFDMSLSVAEAGHKFIDEIHYAREKEQKIS